MSNPPIDLKEWKRKRDAKAEAEAPGTMSDEEFEAIDEQVVEADEFFCDRLDEVFHLACRRFPLADTASLMESAYQHMVNLLLDYYRIGPPDERDLILSAELGAAVALRRYEGSCVSVRCKHKKPYHTCADCTKLAVQGDQEFLAMLDDADD